MIGVVDLKEIRFESHDLDDLRGLLKQLVGQAFRFFRVAYGEELRLHLGDLLTHSNPRLARHPRGSYVIGARASSWIVNSAPRSAILFSDTLTPVGPEEPPTRVDIRVAETHGYVTPGSIVVSATAVPWTHGFSLQLAFSDNSKAMIFPDPEDYVYTPPGEGVPEGGEGPEMEIADWEILTPRSRVLRVGPGSRWCYLDSEKRKGD